MKNMKKILVLIILFSGFAASSFAQTGTNATATSSAYVITPIGIANTGDMNFGTLAVNTSAGTVLLPATDGTPLRTRTGGVTLPAIIGTVSDATFHIVGEGASQITIGLPGSPVDITGPGSTMSVSLFTCYPSITPILSGGMLDIYVGATLNVNGSQGTGSYTTPVPFTVTVNYN